MLTAAQTINLLLVDDHAMFREGLARVLEKEPGIKVVAQCGSSSEALAALGECGATMVLLDVDLGGERALDFVIAAKQQGFEGQILIVTAGISGQEAVQLVQAGVVGILHKHHSTEVLRRSIRQAAAGEVCLEQDYLTSLFRSIDRTRAQSRPLLNRSRQVSPPIHIPRPYQ